MTDELLDTTLGGWVLRSYAGAGKSALVFQGKHGKRIGAVKVFDPELVERFGRKVQEERINRELSLIGKHHENLVRILDGGTCATTNYLFVVMEYLDAPNLADMIGEVPREAIWPLISQVARAAHFLETAGLVHRDIKPDNIAVDRTFTKATLLDLGVVRPIGVAGLTDHDIQKDFIGTLQYSSPEFLFRNERDDVDGWRALTFYQLGAVIHDLIMRRRIFDALAHPYARLVEAVKHEVPEVNATDVSRDLVLLARNCLIKDPEQRLKYVQWDDFEPRSAKVNPAFSAKERMRRRRALAQGEQPENSDAGTEQHVRAVRRKVEELLTQIQGAIKQECIGSDLFPPFEVHEIQDPKADIAHFVAIFARSEEHSLPKSLSVLFSLKLIDLPSVLIELSIGAAFINAELDRKQALGIPVAGIYQGAFEEAVVRTTVYERLYQLLDLAQGAGNLVTDDKMFVIELRENAEGV